MYTYIIKLYNGDCLYFVNVQKNLWYYFQDEQSLNDYINNGVFYVQNKINNHDIKKMLNGIVFNYLENNRKDIITIFSKTLYKKFSHILRYNN